MGALNRHRTPPAPATPAACQAATRARSLLGGNSMRFSLASRAMAATLVGPCAATRRAMTAAWVDVSAAAAARLDPSARGLPSAERRSSSSASESWRRVPAPMAAALA